ncbi:lipopolysaccharide biosynthesis protein [Actinomyces ruminicola]|uniref:Membrane protein involved in the export of O-antigen and teichoic acid n=1 Tax=Actinomyces ruminicola TaxID=332524 RepID=A0A1G9TVD9_9ACTO|nr:lipopolysaccharide biosynthesis protein [Actinomyces ruminicola]SDM51699.1 Membrane protein involved in the export of O-antigen and teichoic acid [Actinomyces ruminicola]
MTGTKVPEGRRGRGSVLMRNTAVFAIGNLAVKVVSLVLMPLYTTSLTAAEYGVAELVNSGIEIALPLLSLGVIEALYRFSINEGVSKRALLANSSIVLLGGIAAAAVLVFVSGRWFGFNNAPEFFALFVAASFYKATTQFARGLGHVRRFVLYGLLNAVVLVASSGLLLVWLRAGVAGYLWSYTLGFSIAGSVAFVASREYVMLMPLRPDPVLLRRMLGYSFPLVPNLLSWWVVSVSGRYIVLWGAGAAAAGLFTAASKMPALVNVATSVFQQAWQYSTAIEINSADGGVFFGRVLRYYSLAVLSMAGVIIALNRIISVLLLQSEFRDAWRFVPLLLLAASFGAMSLFFESFYQALLKSRMLMISTMIGAVVNVVMALLLVQILGAWGAAIAAVSAYAVVLVVRIRDIVKRIEIPISRARLAYQLGLLSVSAVCMSFADAEWLAAVNGCCLLLLFTSDTDVLREGFARLRRSVSRQGK